MSKCVCPLSAGGGRRDPVQRWRVRNPGLETRSFLGESLSKAAKRQSVQGEGSTGHGC